MFCIICSTNHITPSGNQVTSGGVTIVKVGGSQPQATAAPQEGYTRRAKLGDSRSTGRLHTAANANTHRSMTRLNIAGKSHIINYLHLRVSKRVWLSFECFVLLVSLCKLNYWL